MGHKSNISVKFQPTAESGRDSLMSTKSQTENDTSSKGTKRRRKAKGKKNKLSDDRKHGSGTRKLYSCQRRKRPKHSDRSKWNGCVSWNPIINMPLNLNGQCNIDQAFNNSNSSGDESSDQSIVSDSSSENC